MKLLLASSLAAGALLMAPVAEATKAKHELKIATVAPEGSTWMKVMRQIDAEIREATGNEVGFKIYPGGVQGDEKVVLRKTRTGQLHGGGLTGLGLGLIAPELRAIEIPFLVHTNEDVDRVYDGISATFESSLQQNGFTLLGWAEVGFVYVFSQEPIASGADLKKAKMWLWEGDELAASFYREAGVVPVPLAVTDVMTSLQTHLIDAVYCSPLACLALQWFTRVQYFTDLPLTFASGAVVVTNKSFQKIPEQHRQKVRQICKARFRELVEQSRQQNDESLAVIEESGVAKVSVTPAQVEEFHAVGLRVQRSQVGTLYSQDLLDQILATLKP
jgi:TRAP-type C4-dicarboxylate transport system substrate-binding protein